MTEVVIKSYLLSLLFRRDPPPTELGLPVVLRIYQESTKLHEVLREAATRQSNHWLNNVHRIVVQQQHQLNDEVSRNHEDPMNINNHLRHSRSGIYGFSPYKNPKGSFLALVAQQAEYEVMTLARGWLKVAVQKHNAEVDNGPLSDTCPLVHDGILVPFQVPVHGLRLMEAFINTRSDGMYHPIFDHKRMLPPHSDHTVWQFLAEAKQVVQPSVAEQRLSVELRLMIRARCTIAMRLGYNRFVNPCDLWAYLDGMPRGSKYTPHEYLREQYASFPESELQEMEHFPSKMPLYLPNEAARSTVLSDIDLRRDSPVTTIRILNSTMYWTSRSLLPGTAGFSLRL